MKYLIGERVTSLPVRGEWIEIGFFGDLKVQLGKSLPVRGEWIEIPLTRLCKLWHRVSPREGRVD